MKIIYTSVLFCSLLFSGCSPEENSNSLEGLWIEVENNIWVADGILHFSKDSILLYNEYGFKIKGSYHPNGDSSLLIKDYYHIYDPLYKYEVPVKSKYYIKGDTLIWKISGYNDERQFVKSNYETYLEHYANSKGLKISLPEANPASSTIVYYNSRNAFVDFFIGYQTDGSIGMVFNEEPANQFQTADRLQLLKDSIGVSKRIIFRIFADKNIPVEYIHDILTTMKRTEIDAISYAVENKDRPYSKNSSGINLKVIDLKLIPVPDSIKIEN